MESRQKMNMFLAIATLAAISAVVYRRRRSMQNKARERCYLELENKPQNSFKRVLADNSYAPFKHFNRFGKDEGNFTNVHPYEEEITFLLEHPPTPPTFIDSDNHSDMGSSYVWVTTRFKLEELVGIFSKEQVFAVDTEQHSLRSFLGFTALMQISTNKEDYLLDTIALHDEMSILRPVFADPSICKVFHGSDNDVLWLQRDFHIYVVNLFDTAKACEVLSKPHKSLAYLLETYCGIATNKLFQREDWRQRPLSAEMIEYARADAHYLLYIADCLVRELKIKSTENSNCSDDKSSLLLEAYRRSNTICLQLYMKEVEACPGDSAAASICSRHLSNGGTSWRTSETIESLRKLCAWRDLMARVHDESLRFVLSDQAVAGLATKVPKTSKEIYDTINGANSNLDSSNIGSSLPPPSPVVCSHSQDLYYLLEEGVDDSIDVSKRVLQEHLGPNGTCPLSIYNYPLLSKYNSKLVNRLLVKQNGGKPTKQVGRKASRELFVQKFACKSPVYHNCRIYASDGRLLCYCDRRKLEWYLRRDLAKLVDNDPPAIMLLFEPKGRPEDEDNDFYIQSKKNMCVGCGERNHYLRYRIIPSCYRVYFPEHLKSHRSHDIVLLCVDCHEISHSAAEKYKRLVAKEFGIPLFVRKVADSAQNQVVTTEASGLVENLEAGVSPLQLRTAAMALLRHGSRMPLSRREELTETVRMYFGGRDISDEDLEKALLVGMSPHERRRFEKKRGLSFKDGVGSTHSKKCNESNCKAPGDRHLCEDMDHAEEIFDKSRTTDGENTEALHFDDSNCNGTKPDDVCHWTTSPVNTEKLSLLGHGPHGKQVVEHLLKEDGEDGIREFCQKWRQVFVEGIHPRFLPAGWDIMHSGRRDFGEYSVYNPANRSIDSAKS